jgi:hypothetical protein
VKLKKLPLIKIIIPLFTDLLNADVTELWFCKFSLLIINYSIFLLKILFKFSLRNSYLRIRGLALSFQFKKQNRTSVSVIFFIPQCHSHVLIVFPSFLRWLSQLPVFESIRDSKTPLYQVSMFMSFLASKLEEIRPQSKIQKFYKYKTCCICRFQRTYICTGCIKKPANPLKYNVFRICMIQNYLIPSVCKHNSWPFAVEQIISFLHYK